MGEQSGSGNAGRLAEAIQALEEKRYQDAVQMLGLAASLNPGDFEAHFHLGRAYLGQGNLPLAEHSLRRAVGIDPSSGKALCALAWALIPQGKLGPARQALEAALSLDPRNDELREAFARLVEAEGAAGEVVPDPELLALAQGPEVRPMSRDAWLNLASGGAAAVLFCAVQNLNFVLYHLSILVHEAGHALAGWALGRASLPAFNFMDGGGVTIMDEAPSLGLIIVVYGLIGVLIVASWFHPVRRAASIALLVAYAAVVHTRLNDIVGLSMGHGFELVVATMFFYTAVSGRDARPGEQPIFAFCGAYLAFHNVHFAWKLLHDAGFRADYRNPASGMTNDFVRLTWATGQPMETLVWAFLILALLPPVAAILVHRYRSYW